MQELLESVDTMIVIPNEKLLAVAKDAGFFESFRIADDVLRQGVQGISDIITIPGIINRDFADVKTTMAGMGYAVMGTAGATGRSRAMEAAQAAMASPLLEAGAIDGARGILINISGSSSLKLSEVNEASTSSRARRMRTPTSSSAPCSTRNGGRGEDHGDRDRLPAGDAGAPGPHAERRAAGPRGSAVEMGGRPATPDLPAKKRWMKSQYLSPSCAGEPVEGEPVIGRTGSWGSFRKPMAVPVAETVQVEPAALVPMCARREHGENLDIPAFMRRGGLIKTGQIFRF